MALEVRGSINGSPFVSLFLILAVICLASAIPARGLKVEVAVPLDQYPCGDGDRLLVVRVMADGGVRLNEESLKPSELPGRLKKAFLNRADRLLFVLADEDAAFGQVTSAIDAAAWEVEHIALMSHFVARHPGNCGPTLPLPVPLRVPTPGLDSVHFWPWYKIR